jgi:hypothetical protein
MVARRLRDTEVGILNKSDDSSSGSSSFSDSSDNEIDDLAVADAIINDDSDWGGRNIQNLLVGNSG